MVYTTLFKPTFSIWHTPIKPIPLYTPIGEGYGGSCQQIQERCRRHPGRYVRTYVCMYVCIKTHLSYVLNVPFHPPSTCQPQSNDPLAIMTTSTSTSTPTLHTPHSTERDDDHSPKHGRSQSAAHLLENAQEATKFKLRAGICMYVCMYVLKPIYLIYMLYVCIKLIYISSMCVLNPSICKLRAGIYIYMYIYICICIKTHLSYLYAVCVY
jgi:hypothetical protein